MTHSWRVGPRLTFVLLVCALCTTGACSASTYTPSASQALLSPADLPNGWSSSPSSLVGFGPPCVTGVRAALASDDSGSAGFVGGEHGLATLTERVAVLGADGVKTSFDRAVQAYAACGGSFTEAGTPFNMTVQRLDVALMGDEAEGFRSVIASASVQPPTLPGFVEFVRKDQYVLELGMTFATIPPDAATFNEVVIRAVAKVP